MPDRFHFRKHFYHPDYPEGYTGTVGEMLALEITKQPFERRQIATLAVMIGAIVDTLPEATQDIFLERFTSLTREKKEK